MVCLLARLGVCETYLVGDTLFLDLPNKAKRAAVLNHSKERS